MINISFLFGIFTEFYIFENTILITSGWIKIFNICIQKLVFTNYPETFNYGNKLKQVWLLVFNLLKHKFIANCSNKIHCRTCYKYNYKLYKEFYVF